MESHMRVAILAILLSLQIGICISKVQRYNTNVDFLLHEAGGIATPPKKDYEHEFPSLRPSSTTSQQTKTTQAINGNALTTAKPQTPKRDYVAPQYPTPKPIQANNEQKTSVTAALTTAKPQPPKRDYVAPQYPTPKPTHTNNEQKTTSPPKNITPTPNNNGHTSKPSSPKRDYVAPQFPTLKPVPDHSKGSTGNVQGLINFYDSMNKGSTNGPKKPSYSSMVSGSTVSSSTVTTQKPTHLTPKTPSFSTIVAGSTKQYTTTPSPTSPNQKTTLPSNGKYGQSTGGPVMPSSIVNTNQNSNQAGSKVSNADLQALSEDLLRKDSNNAAKYVTVNYQEKTTSQAKDDKAPLPLITAASNVWNIPTVQKFLPLLDNYERDTLVNEYVTSQERTEENAFMDAIMSTPVIRHLMNFLKDKGYVTPDPRQQRDFLKQMWFGLYSRGKGKISSSGFEHVFVSELKNGEVSGLHNWIYFSKEEAANRVNYLGYLKKVQLNDRGVVMKIHFNQQGVDKPVDSIFIGTSPELEIALYTLCFVTRVGEDCPLKLGNQDVNIITHNFRYRSKNYIGSAYPQI